eukprot:IDg1551t1
MRRSCCAIGELLRKQALKALKKPVRVYWGDDISLLRVFYHDLALCLRLSTYELTSVASCRAEVVLVAAESYAADLCLVPLRDEACSMPCMR